MKEYFKFIQVVILLLLWVEAQSQYCTPGYTSGCSSGDGLVLFQLNTINQSIPCGGVYYHDYTTISTQVQRGVITNITFQAGYSSTYVTLWADLNNNNVFEASEILVNGFNCPASYTNYTANFTLPAVAALGNHRLRFRTNWSSGTTDPCGTLSYGNAADFTINVIDPPPVGTLQGTITDFFTGNPIPGVIVIVNSLLTVVSNAAGVYVVTNVPCGLATINAYCAGFTPYSGTAMIICGQTTIKNIIMSPIPSVLQGYIMNGCDSTPIAGARVEVGNISTYSLSDGFYIFPNVPVGSQAVVACKVGFICGIKAVSLNAGDTTICNFILMCTANSPGTGTATLNSAQTAVDFSWLPPSGEYEIIYDDGKRENWSVWATTGNMNAVKFTPITGEVQVKSGSVHIGDAGNYPAGTVPSMLAPFQFAVYNATGSGGMPGVQVGDLVDVVPTNFGWNTFTFPNPESITGNFYLVMIQGGIPPAAAGIGIDETTSKLRSYSKFGSGPWLPASGNYMIRAIVYGQGGP